MSILRGEIIKRKSRSEILLERKFLTRSYLLKLNRDLCNGCGVCAEICPREATETYPPSVVEGRLTKKPTIDFDIDSCILCGECAVLCPLNALRMEVDGEEISTIVKNEAFPVLLRSINVTKEKCKPECKLKCQEDCPREAIKVSTENSRNGKILRITDVQIDELLCLYCKRCESACPLDAIHVRKPYRGTIELNAELCPEGCRACIDICPTQAIQQGEDDRPIVMPDYCVYCSACQQVCPKEAIKVSRELVFHTDIRSAAWLTALKKLTCIETVAKELEIKSGIKRFSRARERGL